MEVATDENLETLHRGLFVIGDCGGVTHSLSQASASGVHVARYVAEKYFPDSIPQVGLNFSKQ